MWKRAYEVVCIGSFRNFNDLLVRCAYETVTYILEYRPAEKENILADKTNVVP